MPRRHRDQTFRSTDFVRSYKSAQKAGIPNPIIEIDTVTRTIRVIPGDPSKTGATSEAEPTPLEQWRKKRSGQG